MKLKFKQSVFIIDKNRMVDKDTELEIENEKQAQSFIDADFAVEVIEEVEKTVKRKSQPKVSDK